MQEAVQEIIEPLAKEPHPAAATPAPSAAPHHVFLVDGSGFIFRAYHALPPLSRSDGTPTSAVLGFSNMLAKLLSETDADHIAVVFDAKGTSFRNRIYDQYKAQRPEPAPDLVPQFGLVRRATEAFGVCQIELDDFEADDLIATYARHAIEAGATVTIVSSDKDLMQLVGEKVTMLDPIKNRPIGVAEVRERFGVGPERVIDVQALCGDSVDNVPGVPGIGVKTAAELINTYGDLETLLARAGEIKQPKRRQVLIENEKNARLSKELVKLDDDVPLPCPLSALAVKPLAADELLPFLSEMEFRALASRMTQRLSMAAAAIGPAEHLEPVLPEIPPFNTPRTYALVDTIEGLDHWIEAAGEAGVVAIWPEASAVAGTRPALCGIALALAPGLAAYVPVGHRPADIRAPSLPLNGTLTSAALEAGSPLPGAAGEGAGGREAGASELTLQTAIERLRPLLEDPGVLKIGHDVKSAAHLLSRYGVMLTPYDCTMLMSYVLDGGQFEHTIENLVRRSFEYELPALKELVGTGKSVIAFAEVMPDKARDFAAERADAVLRLHMLLKARLIREKMTAFYETIERPLVPVVASMEREGIRVDPAALGELSRDFEQRIAGIEKAIFQAVGNGFNIGSTKQLGDVLFEKLQLPGGKKGKTGAYGTDASILEELAPLHEVPGLVLEWRQLTKLKSTYADALAEEIDRDSGRVHTSYALAVAATGRFSSNNPNLQNIPIRTEEGRRIRRAFVAEAGHLLLSADYSQIELRLAAHVADVPELKQAFRDGIDIHALTASQVFGVPLAEMDASTRRRAKAINFGIIYGISAFGLGQQIGVPQSEAGAYIRAYFERFPAIRAYMERIKTDCRSTGHVETIFGRKCWIPGIRDVNPARRAGAERQAINAPLQGSAADIIKRAMARIPAELAREKLRARMLLQVHDELLFEAPEAEVEHTAEVVRRVMEGACAPHCELSVPLVVETGWAQSWDEAH
ncbi:MAG: DNA polymerase I [Alphaproteobacteria bacterium]|nr:DNA polymerase I [Alphaproteobacteria bacterium]